MSVLTADPAAAGGGQGNPPASGTPPGNPPTTDWRTSLPDDLRTEKVFESIKGKDWNEAGPVLAKNYVNAQRMVGADKLVVPGPHATPEETAAFYGKLGRPDTPDKYTYKLPEGLPAEQINKPLLDGWLKELHEAGVPLKQADRIVSKYLADQFAESKAAKQAEAKKIADWETSLKQEFGAKYDEKLNYAQWSLKEFGGTDGKLAKFLDETGLGSHPEVVKFFADVGLRMSDDKARTGGARPPAFGSGPNTAAEAQAALNMFNNDQEKQKALFDNRHLGHDAAVAERTRLFQMAFPKKET